MCHFVIGQRGHLWFLHVSGSYWITCRVPVVPHVSFLLAHVSCCGRSKCHFFIGPCHIFIGPRGVTIYNTSRVFLLLDHVSRCCTSACQYFIGPRVVTWATHVFFYLTTWQDRFVPYIWFVLAHMSYPGTYTCYSLVCPRVRFLFNDVVCAGSTTCTPIIVSEKIHYCTEWLHA
jgi:hypothetical protein